MQVYVVERNLSDQLYGPIVAAFLNPDDADRYAERRECCVVRPIELRGIDENFLRLAANALGYKLLA